MKLRGNADDDFEDDYYYDRKHNRRVKREHLMEQLNNGAKPQDLTEDIEEENETPTDESI